MTNSNLELLNKASLKLNNNSEQLSIARNNNSESYTFQIDSSNIKMISIENVYTSYTFSVMPNNETNILQNIVVSNFENGSDAIYLLEYELSTDINNINNYDNVSGYIVSTQFYDLSDEIVDINSSYNDTSIQNRTNNDIGGNGANCAETETYFTCENTDGNTVIMSGYPELDDCKSGGGITQVTVITIDFSCINTGGGSTGGGTGYNDSDDEDDDGVPDYDNSGSGNGGENTPNNNDDDTDPCQENGTATSFNDGNNNCVDGISMPLLPRPNEGDVACVELRNLSNTDEFSANINPIITELRTKTGTGENEFSISFRKTTNGGVIGEKPDTDGIKEGKSDTESEIKIGTVWFGAIHTHPKGKYPMFSWTDVNRLRDVYNGLHSDFNKRDVFIMIVNDDGTVYALNINDITKLTSKLNAELASANGATEEDKEKNLNRDLQKDYKNDSNIERAFLKKFNDYGISLFKANDQNLSNWSKLELDDQTANNPTVNILPCL